MTHVSRGHALCGDLILLSVPETLDSWTDGRFIAHAVTCAIARETPSSATHIRGLTTHYHWRNVKYYTCSLPEINNFRSFCPMTNDMARLAGYRPPMICIVMSENGGV